MSKRWQATTLICAVCGLLLIPADLEGREAVEARAAALRHAQRHVQEAGLGPGRALAQVGFWRVSSAVGGR
jgi:hypothetical protein